MKKLIFLDLDGTLWNNEKVPLSALSAILQAKKNGHKILRIQEEPIVKP